VSDLAAFLAARLSEDEAIAREAAGLTECWVAEEPAIGVVLVDGEPLIEGHITGLTAHIARHDPARVLREAGAMRARLALLAEAQAELDRLLADEHASPMDQAMAVGRVRGARMAVRYDAAVWRDYPDYDEAWRPGA
jgi:hypothetical protein